MQATKTQVPEVAAAGDAMSSVSTGFSPVAIAGGALLALILGIDVSFPPGFAGAAAYVAPVLLGLWTPGRRYTLAAASIATVVAVVARLWSEPLVGIAEWIVWLNRGTSIFAVWTTAFVVLLYKSAQAAGDNERKKSAAILETAVDGMVSIDEEGRIELFNRAAEDMFGWHAEEVLGRNVSILMAPPYRDSHDAHLRRYLATGERRVIGIGREVQGLRKDGRAFPLELALAEVPLEGRRIFTAILRDISERKQHERTRDELVASLADKNAELERFTYTVSHDLKSPLVTIKGFLGLIERAAASGDTATISQDIARVSAASDRMKQLLDEVLELSRIGRVVGPTVDVPLGELADEALEALAGPIEARGVAVDVAPELPVVRGDRVRLRQLLQNLIENAVKHMGTEARPRVSIGAREQGREVVSWVEDNGPGIDARYADRIFGLFEKLDRSTEGTGVGLALVRRIAEVHGGRAWVEPAAGGAGARFCFALPSARGEA